MNEIASNTNMGKGTTKNYEQNAVSWGLTKVSEIEDLSKTIYQHCFEQFSVEAFVICI